MNHKKHADFWFQMYQLQRRRNAALEAELAALREPPGALRAAVRVSGWVLLIAVAALGWVL